MTSLNLAQRRAIDRSKENLVPRAEAWLKGEGETLEPRVSPKDFGHSQLRNLIAIANETDSPAVVLNFVRYQMGRDTQGRSWNKVDAGESLGDRLIRDLSADRGAIHDALLGVPGLDGDPTARQLATMELVRQYLGFASRYFKYLELQQKRSSQRQGGR